MCYNGGNPSGGMIFLNNHVKGFRGGPPWRLRIRFYPPCIYYRENIVTGDFVVDLNFASCGWDLLVEF